MLETNLAVFRYLHDHPGAKAGKFPGVVQWTTANARMQHSAWDTAHQRGITVYMPQEEVMRKDELYGFFERIDKAHEDEADAIADTVAYMFENPDPSQLTPSQIDRQIDLTKQVLSKHLRHGYLMQNLGEEFEQFRPGPSREELNHMLNLPQ